MNENVIIRDGRELETWEALSVTSDLVDRAMAGLIGGLKALAAQTVVKTINKLRGRVD